MTKWMTVDGVSITVGTLYQDAKQRKGLGSVTRFVGLQLADLEDMKHRNKTLQQ